MDSCYQKEVLERFVINVSLDAATKRQIHDHVANCTRCREHVDSLRSYYREVEDISEDTINRLSIRLYNKLNGLHPSRIVVLYPMPESNPNQSLYILAAESPEAHRYINVRSYTDADEQIIARLMKDNESQAMSLYLLSDEENPLQDFILEIEGIQEHFIPDEGSKIHLSNLQEKDIDGKTFRLKSPLAVFNLEPITDLKERIITQGQFQIQSSEHDEIQIMIDEVEDKTHCHIRILKLSKQDEPGQVSVVVKQKGDRPVVSQAKRGLAVFEALDPEKILKIHIY